MRANSLALRLFLSATAWAVIILLITGVVLSSLYRQAVERAFDRRLGVYLRTLVADVASPEEAGEKSPQSLGEPLFELPLSGWYWQVTRLDPAKTEVRASRSLLGRRPAAFAGLWDCCRAKWLSRGLCARPGRSTTGLVERNIDLGDEGHYLVAVAGDCRRNLGGNAVFRPGADRYIFDPRRRAVAYDRYSRFVSVSRHLNALRTAWRPFARQRRAPSRNVSGGNCSARARDQCIDRGQ